MMVREVVKEQLFIRLSSIQNPLDSLLYRCSSLASECPSNACSWKRDPQSRIAQFSTKRKARARVRIRNPTIHFPFARITLLFVVKHSFVCESNVGFSMRQLQNTQRCCRIKDGFTARFKRRSIAG